MRVMKDVFTEHLGTPGLRGPYVEKMPWPEAGCESPTWLGPEGPAGAQPPSISAAVAVGRKAAVATRTGGASH